MDYERIIKKPGAEWTEKEINTVFEQLILDINGFVIFAYRKLITSDTTDKLAQAKEVVDVKIYALFCALQSYNPSKYKGKKDPLHNYLFTIIARETVKVNQKTIKQQELNRKETKKPKEPKRLSREEVLQELSPYLARLTRTYSQALRLFYLEEKSCEESAKVCGCSITAFKVRLHRARRKCQELRKEKYNDSR